MMIGRGGRTAQAIRTELRTRGGNSHEIEQAPLRLMSYLLRQVLIADFVYEADHCIGRQGVTTHFGYGILAARLSRLNSVLQF